MHRGLVSRRHPINSQQQIRAHPRTESLVAAAVRWVERIMACGHLVMLNSK